MALEIEAKMKVPALEPVRRRLTELGGQSRGRLLEVNTFFDTPDRRLLAADQGLRIRQTTDMASGKPGKTTVTFKGPQGNSTMKIREEIEFAASDAAAVEAMLGKLDLHRTMSFEKRRESWEFGACHVELDELPILGIFVEIEGANESIVMGVREKLNLADFPIVKTSYTAMLAAHLKQMGQSTRSITFSGN
jgi:adenylate cyclase class 2